MNFDIEGARKAGYSDQEIASYLAEQKGFDLKGALKAGYSSREVLGFLDGGGEEKAFDFEANKGKVLEALKLQGFDAPEDQEQEYQRMRQAGKLDDSVKNNLTAARDRVASRGRSLGEVAEDTGRGVMAGGAGVVQAAGWLAGHVPGLRDVGDAIQKTGEESQEYWKQGQSDELKAQQERLGEAKGVTGTLQAAIQNPGAVADDIAQSVLGMMAGMGAGGVAENLVVRTVAHNAAKQAVAQGLTGVAAEKLVQEAVLKATTGALSSGAVANVGANAATEALQTAGNTGADVEKFARERGLSPEAARDLANRTAAKAGAIDLPFSMLGAGVERRFLQGKLEGGVRGAILNPAKEGAEEFGQSAGEEYFTKRGMQEVDPSIEMDPLGAGTRGALAGAGQGGAMHITGAAQRMLPGQDPLTRELTGLPGEIDAAQWNPDQIDAAARGALSPDRAQMQVQDDASHILATLAQAPDVDTAISAALELAGAPITLPEVTPNDPTLDAAGRAGQGDFPGGSGGDSLALPGVGLGGSDSAPAPLGGGVAPAPVGAANLADPSVANDILNLERQYGLSEPQQVAQEASAPAGPQTSLANLTLTDRPTGTLEVAGPGARELVTQLVPGESVQQRKDGSVIVGLKHADAVRQAVAQAKQALPVSANMPGATQQETPDVGQQQDGLAAPTQDRSGQRPVDADRAGLEPLIRHLGEDAGFQRVGADAIPARAGEAQQVTQARRQEAALVEKLFGKAGTEVVFVTTADGSERFGGAFIPEAPGRIYIDVNNKGGLQVALRIRAAHEALHDLEERDPELFQKVALALRKAGAAKLTAEKFQPLYDPSGEFEVHSNSHATSEQVANLFGNVLADPAVIQELLDRIEAGEPKGAAKVVAALKKAIAKIRAAIQELGSQYNTRAYQGDLEEVQRVLKDAYVEFARKQQKSAIAAERDLAEAQFSPPKAPGSDIGHKRTKAGDYVGAPAGMTPAKLGALRTRLEAITREGEPGRFWYEESSRAILAAAEGDKGLAEKIAGLLAIYSPQATVSGNTTMGLKALYQWMAGEPIKARMATQDKKAQAWMDGTMGEEDALQIKTGNFFKNLMREIDSERYGFDAQGATIDMWMARVFGYGSKAIGSEARYYFAERETKRLAEKLGWEPQQVQAAVWVAIKSRVEAIADQARETGIKNGWLKKVERVAGGKTNISWPPKDGESREKYETLILKMALAQDPDPSGLMKASYNFGTALKERIGQISWEAKPGVTTGVLPGIFDAPLEQQAEYLAAIDAALRDENGNDLIAQKLGLPVLQTNFGPSAWQMDVGAGAQTVVAIATDRDQGNKKISVTAPAKKLLNLYSAIRGYVLAQEAVVWHYPIFDAAKKNANGIQLDFGRDPTHDEVVALYRAIHAVSGRDDWAPAYVPGVGVRILNFSDVPNLEFHAMVRKAAETADGVPAFQGSTFQSDGDYISNDWVKHPDGAQYKEIIDGQVLGLESRGSGRSDLQGWVESELRPRTERVNKEFAAKYGWGKPKFSPVRSGAGDDLGAGSLRAPSYGTGQPGSVSVTGVHYSGAERSNLSGFYYGQGMKGAEKERLFRESADPQQRRRIHFYVDEGKGVRPESDVGSHAHLTRLENVYDWNQDPLDLWAEARDRHTDPVDRINFVEREVIRRGFDGVYASGAQGNQGVVVLLGDRHAAVPVQYAGTNYRGGEVKAAEPQAPKEETPGSKILKSKALPAGQVSGERWKQILGKLMPEINAAVLDDAQLYYRDQVARAVDGVKFSPAARWYYSQLERAIEQAPAKVFGPATQVKAWLLSNQAKLGIKQDELQWTGILDWLDLQGKAKVTQADVLAYLQGNGVQVEEVMKGGRYVFTEDDQERLNYLNARWNELNEAEFAEMEDLRHLKDDAENDTKYGKYVLPGGENYRELLLTLPDRSPRRLKRGLEYRQMEDGTWNVWDRDDWVFREGYASREELEDIVAGDTQLSSPGLEFRSGHWDEKNILAHIRFNDRTDAEASRVLFIEEVQSDWGQQGKKQGFAFRYKSEEVKPARDGAEDQTFWYFDVPGNMIQLPKAKYPTQEAARQYILREKRTVTGGVEPAPFVTDTKAWIALALKRMIAYAAQNGYAKVAFVNGDQSAERYDLSKQIDSIKFNKMGDGYIFWNAFKDGERVAGGDHKPEELADHVGKEIAEKMAGHDGPGELSGLDLKVGGDGMKIFYNQIVPQVVNDVLKKLGGGKMEAVSINTDLHHSLEFAIRERETGDFALRGRVDSNSDWAPYGVYKTREAAEERMAELKAGTERSNQPGFTITPVLRDKVAAGLPLFTPARNFMGQPIQNAWVEPELTGFDNVVRQLQDKLIDTKRVVATIKEAGVQVGTEFDPYSQEVLFHGRTAKRVHDFADTELKALLNEMRLAGVKMEDFENYLWARHAPERNAQIASINPNMPDGGSGLTNAEAQQILAGRAVAKNGRAIQIDQSKLREYQRLAAQVRAINDRTLQTLVDYGLETQDTVNTWKRTYPNYVPLNRDLEADDNYLGAFSLGLGTGQGFSVRGSASQRALGSQRNVVDILANLAMQRERAVTRGEKNRVALATYGLALKAPNPDFWLPINPDAPKQARAKTVQELVTMGLNPIDAENIAMEPLQSYLDPQTGLVAQRINPALRNRDNVLFVRVNGEDRFLFFSSDERAQQMVRNLKNLDNDQLGFFLQQAASVTRWFASVNTQYNPVFGLVNGIRDMQSAVLNLGSTPLAGHKAKVVKYGLSALAGIYQDLRAHRKGGTATSAWALEFEEFGNEGGQTGYRDMFQTSKARTDALAKVFKELSIGKVARWNPLNISETNPIYAWLSDYNTAIENAFRVAAYKVAKENGMSRADAAKLAKNLTVNFNKKGLAATQTGALYAFFNAAVQGTARIGETVLEHNGNPSDWKNLRLTKLGKQIIVGGLTLGVIQALLGAAAGWDDDEPKQFQREKNFIIPVFGTDKYVSIPMPLGFHVLPNIGRIATEYALSGFKNGGDRLIQFFSVLADSFNPLGNAGASLQTLFPTIADPLIALESNRDWTGQKIYKEDFNVNQPTPGWTRAKNTATPWARAMAYGFNWISGGFGPYERGHFSPTPDQIDYVIGQVTGGVGRELSKVAQAAKAPVIGEELPLYKWPVAGRFVGETQGAASEVGRFYENLRRIGAHKDPLERMKDDGKSDLVETYMADHPEARYLQAADKAQQQMQKLERQKQMLIKNGAEREAIRNLEARKKEVATVFNRTVRKVLD